ncbi:MAG TPA: Gfo/Idh/MocA family oxidoreductase [Verrucomicrobiae bacterium]|nr:Gfo/Idh/MocA family oxidoreductase [Verrucomicrobiae bacterium]
MNRRAFLKSTAGIVTWTAFPGGIAAAPSTNAANARIKIGFLGTAHSHAMGKVKVIQESRDFELVGICEESDRVREPYSKMGVKSLSQDELFRECAVVAVESAVRDHARHAKLALEAGKNIHLEKPPADTFKDFRQLVALAREKNRLLQVGYMWRYNPGLVAALEASRQGWLGDIYLVRATMNTLLDGNRRPEWAEFKGGAMFELGCHLIDPIVRLLGRPKAVTPLLKKHGDFSDNLADNNVVVFEFKGVLAIVTSATLQPSAGTHRSFEILGTNGTATLKPIEPPTLQIDLAKAAGPYVSGKQTVPMPDYRRYVGDFVELAAAVRRQRPLSVTLDEELLVQETVIRACEM